MFVDHLRPKQRGIVYQELSGFFNIFWFKFALAQSPRGNIFQTAAVAAQDPFKQFQAAQTS